MRMCASPQEAEAALRSIINASDVRPPEQVHTHSFLSLIRLRPRLSCNLYPSPIHPSPHINPCTHDIYLFTLHSADPPFQPFPANNLSFLCRPSLTLLIPVFIYFTPTKPSLPLSRPTQGETQVCQICCVSLAFTPLSVFSAKGRAAAQN